LAWGFEQTAASKEFFSQALAGSCALSNVMILNIAPYWGEGCVIFFQNYHEKISFPLDKSAIR
jgi:hypothetical protein